MAASDYGNYREGDSTIATRFTSRRSATDRAGTPDDVLQWDLDDYFEKAFLPYPNARFSSAINTTLPLELLRVIFLYSIEVHQMKSGRLASVCRYWRSIITGIASIWSTLKVGTWTESEQVTAWLQRAYPKKVVIDTQRDGQEPSNAQPFAALQDALATNAQWNELTISSFPPENLASQLDFRVTGPMDVLDALHVAVGCVYSTSVIHLLNLVPPSGSSLSDMRLHSAFATAHFLEPHWLPTVQNLTVLIVNGRDIHEPFQLLHSFARLQIFEADHLPLPLYEPDTKLPLLHTLLKLQLRASSVQWMAGRQLPYLEECAVLLPHHWVSVQQHGVELPSCRKLSYHGYPMATVQYFRVPQMKSLVLRSHDCKEQRVYRQLHHLCRLDGTISNLTTLHLALQCSEQALIKVLKYLGALQELVVSITYSSPSWKSFLQSLAAKPSTNDWPEWGEQQLHQKWEDWYSSRTWYVNTLPCLNYLGIQCPIGFSQTECLDNCPLLRLVGWTRAQLTPPLQHLKVWEGRGTTDDIVVDYSSTGYLERHLEQISDAAYDMMVVRGMVTQRLFMEWHHTPLFKLSPTLFFRQLQSLCIIVPNNSKIHFLSYLEQIKELEILGGTVPANVRNIHLPLVHTLEKLYLHHSTFSWMLGRTFKALKEVELRCDRSEELFGHRELEVYLPACTTLVWKDNFMFTLSSFSCPNLQTFVWEEQPWSLTHNQAVVKSLHDFFLNYPYLQQLELVVYHRSGLDSFFQFVFCDALEQELWQDIRSVEFGVRNIEPNVRIPFFNQLLEHQRHYGKWWREFSVTKGEEPRKSDVILRASM